jgi:mRNA interferase MazF
VAGRRVAAPARGELWELDFGATRGPEQGGRRPALVLSTDGFSSGPAGLVVMAPLTSVDKRVPLHVRIEPPEGGLTQTSFVKPEDVRSLSLSRLGRRLGRVSPGTMSVVETHLRVLLDL